MKSHKESLLFPLRTLHTNNFSIESEATVTVLDLAEQCIPELLSQDYIKQNKKIFKRYVFVFKIKHQDKQWKIYKTMEQFLRFQQSMKKKFGRQVPMVPIRKQNQLKSHNIKQFTQFLLISMKKIINIGFYDDDFQNFVNILPAEKGHGIIYTEVPLKKRSGGRYTEAHFTKKITNLVCCRSWRTRYFMVTDQGVFYTAFSKTYEIKEMIPFSSNFIVKFGMNSTGQELGIQIKSPYRTLKLCAYNLYELVIFIHAAKQALKNSPFKDIQRFQSFAGIKSGCESKLYIDGEEYFSDVCKELLNAKKQVYITDWMLTPYMFLKRPCEINERSSRLDYILQGIASRGVSVKIILYMQPKIALNNDSEFVQKYLEELHPNIKVLRHPNFILIPFLWSHHEKMVVIDHKIGFMGGLDLCYGRWDNQAHLITQKNQNYWKGADYCNLRISDIYHPRNFMISNLDSRTQPRLPWHDIGVRLRGGSVSDLDRHFVQYWNFVNFQTKLDDKELLMHCGRQTANFSQPKQANLSIIKDYFVELINLSSHNKELKEEPNPDQLQFYNKFLEDKSVVPQNERFDLSKIQLNSIRDYPRKILNLFKEGQVDDQENQLMITEQNEVKVGMQKHQILRSASTWSLGLQQQYLQKSIYTAYLHLIKNAEHFIYIENQFFISKENTIVECLADRINKAFKNKQKFKVVIIMPLLPAFQGQVDSPSSAVLLAQLHWEYYSICRSKASLYQRLAHIQNIEDYVKFFGLRTHALSSNNIPLTEIIYVHSKLMIVDDRIIILGSANINDRSMLGDRDSQICVLIEDGQQKIVCERMVKKSAHNLRVQLYKQHFGMNYEESEDFHNDDSWFLMINRSEKNTFLYRQIFGCYPDDRATRFIDLKKLKESSDIKKYQKQSELIIGNAVSFPLHFLQKENLSLNPKQKEYFMPEINFT